MCFMDLFNFCYLVMFVEFDCVCFNVFVCNIIYFIWFDYKSPLKCPMVFIRFDYFEVVFDYIKDKIRLFWGRTDPLFCRFYKENIFKY